MNPHYLWLTGTLQVLTFFVVSPTIAVVIAYRAWRGHNVNPQMYRAACIASGGAATLLFMFAKWINADVRTAQYFLQLASFLLSGLTFGVFMGSGFAVLLCGLHWHKATRLNDGSN